MVCTDSAGGSFHTVGSNRRAHKEKDGVEQPEAQTRPFHPVPFLDQSPWHPVLQGRNARGTQDARTRATTALKDLKKRDDGTLILCKKKEAISTSLGWGSRLLCHIFCHSPPGLELRFNKKKGRTRQNKQSTICVLSGSGSISIHRKSLPPRVVSVLLLVPTFVSYDNKKR